MGFNNPAVSWAELRRALSGELPPQGNGGDSPAWSRKRDGYPGVPQDLRGRHVEEGVEYRVPSSELHAHSHFSFLDGASSPEALVEEAARAGLDAITLTDHDGMYGWCASPRPPGRSVFGSATAPSSASGCRPGRTGWPIRRGSICWCWPAAWPGIGGSAG